MDYRELIFSEEFTDYRRKQVVAIVEYIDSLIKDGINGEAKSSEMRGALEMASRIIRLPNQLIDSKYAEKLNKLVTEDIINISAFLVRERLKEIE